MSRRTPVSGGIREAAASRRLRISSTVAALIVLLPWLAAGKAAAEQSESMKLGDAITLDPGATCLDGLRLTEHVRQWLDSDEIDRRIRVRVLGNRRSSNKAVFIVDKGDGYPTERNFESVPESCVELHSALALSIALAIKAVRFDAPLREPPSPSAGLKRVAATFQWSFTTGIVNPAFTAIAPVGPSGRFELGWLRWLDTRLGIMTSAAYGQLLKAGEDWRYDVNLWAIRGDLCYGADPVENLRARACLGAAYGLLKTQGKNVSGPVSGDDRFVGNAQDESWAAGFLSGDLAYTWLELFGLSMGPSIEIDFPLPVWARRYRVVNAAGAVEAESVPVIFGMGASIGWVVRAR